MAERPVIMAVDDEPAALAAMLDALTRRFGGDYRIVPHLSALKALDDLSRIKRDGEEIALVIADQWMPDMTGNEFLGRVRSVDLWPTAPCRRWGDHAASPTIIQAAALGNSTIISTSPGPPPGAPVSDGERILAEWTRVHRPAMELIHIVGDEGSPRSNEIRELLDRNGIPYGFHDIKSPMARRLGEERGLEPTTFPAIFLLDGTMLTDPTDAELMDALGENPDELSCDLAVVGGGPRAHIRGVRGSEGSAPLSSSGT